MRFLLIIAQRRDEAAWLRHGHILNGVWRQVENKASRPHSLTLPPLASRWSGRATRGAMFRWPRAARSTPFRLKRRLDEATGVTDWRLHDLRRTAATNMQDLEIRNEIVQAILNHAVPGVGDFYLRSELEKEKADAVAKWATALIRIVGSGGSISTISK